MRRRVARSTKKSKRCRSGKVRFRDRQSAVTALSRITEVGTGKVPVRVYECPCGGWHLTSAER